MRTDSGGRQARQLDRSASTKERIALRRVPLIRSILLICVCALVAGCGAGESNAFKLASLDSGADATTAETARYQSALDSIDAACKENENELTRMVFAATAQLTSEGIATTNYGFMNAALGTMTSLPARNREDCAIGFALVMGAIRIDGGVGN